MDYRFCPYCAAELEQIDLRVKRCPACRRHFFPQWPEMAFPRHVEVLRDWVATRTEIIPDEKDSSQMERSDLGKSALNDVQGYIVREGTAADVPSVVRLAQMWAEEGCTAGYCGLTHHGEPVDSWLKGGYFFVAEYGGAVVGFVAGVLKTAEYAVFRPGGERFLHVHEIYIHPDHRYKGVGNRLMKRILYKAEANGVTRSVVGSNNVDWVRTYRFYERHGYEMFSIEMVK